jgi:hypothetical protein
MRPDSAGAPPEDEGGPAAPNRPDWSYEHPLSGRRSSRWRVGLVVGAGLLVLVYLINAYTNRGSSPDPFAGIPSPPPAANQPATTTAPAGPGSSSPLPTDTVPGLSAVKLVNDSRAAAVRARSAQIEGRTVVQGSQIFITGTLTPTGANIGVNVGLRSYQIRKVGSRLYVKGATGHRLEYVSVDFVDGEDGKPPINIRQLADWRYWINTYVAPASGSTVVRETVDGGFGNPPAYPVTLSDGSSLLVSSEGPPYPLAFTGTRGSGEAHLTWSHWDEPVTVEAPGPGD